MVDRDVGVKGEGANGAAGKWEGNGAQAKVQTNALIQYYHTFPHAQAHIQSHISSLC